MLISIVNLLASNFKMALSTDKVWMYEEIMMNNDNLESNLLTSILLKICSLYKLNWRSVTV